MKLAVFRAEADGRRTARRLAALGHEAVLAPVLAIVPTGSRVEATVDVVVFTSQHAPPALRVDDVLRLRGMPCFCVGSRTAHAASAAGFSDVRHADGDGAALAAAIRETVPPATRIAFLAGRERKPDVETTLIAGGYPVDVTDVYAAEPAPWTDEAVAAIAACTGALHYSQRSARLAFANGRVAGLGLGLGVATHYCLSDQIADWVQAQGAADIRIAPSPDEAALLDLL